MNAYILKQRLLQALVLLAALAVFGTLAMALWNALIPALFGLPALHYGQALGLMVLARLLFGGLPGFQHRGGFMWGAERHGLREKWMRMSADERQSFIEKEKEFFKFNRRFGRMHPFFEDGADSPAPEPERQDPPK